ncbi:putative tubulin [Cardiosporidium cionae]|uniref:Tubulin n=1 Tax=Cardiosporidium cionae TaxID=476202 RepID=A0ABQ7JC57_9APIC|nr:putative tubulin [Cardiosporidium cionae]|eukprot:KAF8821585.1 putative tubulin [Cardiosporidium cionae]
MPRELITLQVGQCGNQIGYRFWDAALQEHAKYCSDGIFDESISSFFRNVDTRHIEPMEIPFAGGSQKIKSLRARAVLIDMEEGAINELLRGKMGDLFDSRQLITDTSGSGNNWAYGHEMYGPKHREAILESIRCLVEHCDSLQSFLLLHSLGGGTGSGIGTYLLERRAESAIILFCGLYINVPFVFCYIMTEYAVLADEFPGPFRFTTSVFPSSEDDVVTSPYNSCLAMWKLREHASCVFPVSNDALIRLCKQESCKGQKPFDALNNIVAQLLTNLTSSMRFKGSLNVDLNEISTNLVPYPSLHFILSAMSPVGHSKNDNRSLKTLASAFLLRGEVSISDILNNVRRTKTLLKTLSFNQDAFKLGQCMVPPVGQVKSLLYLYNSCEIINLLEENTARFAKLYNRRAHVHHYSRYMDLSMMDEAFESLEMLSNDYRCFQDNEVPPLHFLESSKLSSRHLVGHVKEANREFQFIGRDVVDLWKTGNRPLI